ncbi:MAG: nucleotidyl transferase AbiEii/AbiGii toxin family protein [Bdellovibrionales bacterium]|nr:nucleotidyl transferase AbiEii/AbiGii toxin family protein [Bdellovibrionales bacterium]
MAKIFLHDHKDFEPLLRIVADNQKINLQLVEKDYWIMHALYGLAQQNFKFELKGGTSLSKGFQAIDRFSEDIDIRIEPPVNKKVMFGKNQDKPNQIKTRKEFFEWLIASISIPGILAVEPDPAFDDPTGNWRNAGIRLKYKSHFSALSGVKEGVLLEVGFDDTAPNMGVDISSWALDHALTTDVKIETNKAVAIPCYLPEYTFVEKLQTISTKYRQQQGAGTFPKNFMRHYYDVYRLLELESVQKFLSTPRYEKRKGERFRKGDNLKISENEAFLLRDQNVRSLYKAEYEKTADLYYRGQPKFEQILKKIGAYIHQL